MKTWFTALLLFLVPAVASAQLQKLGPNDGIQINIPEPTVSPDGLDAPDGIRIKATSTTQTGVVVRTWDFGVVRTALLTPQMIPAGAFTLTVHPFNVAGEAEASNEIGPFGKAATPKRLEGVTGSVVAGSASLARPVSGGSVASISTLTSTPSITSTPAFALRLRPSSATAHVEHRPH